MHVRLHDNPYVLRRCCQCGVACNVPATGNADPPVGNRVEVTSVIAGWRVSVRTQSCTQYTYLQLHLVENHRA